MPVKIPHKLPASQILAGENIFIMPEDRAAKQDIRPLKVIILNIISNQHSIFAEQLMAGTCQFIVFQLAGLMCLPGNSI